MSGYCQWRRSSGNFAGIDCKGLNPFEVEWKVGMGPCDLGINLRGLMNEKWFLCSYVFIDYLVTNDVEM